MGMQSVGIRPDLGKQRHRNIKPMLFRRQHAITSPLEHHHAQSPLKLAKKKGAPFKLILPGVLKHGHSSGLHARGRALQRVGHQHASTAPVLQGSAQQLLQQLHHCAAAQHRENQPQLVDQTCSTVTGMSASPCPSNSAASCMLAEQAAVSALCALQRLQQQTSQTDASGSVVFQAGMRLMPNQLLDADGSDDSCQSSKLQLLQQQDSTDGTEAAGATAAVEPRADITTATIRDLLNLDTRRASLVLAAQLQLQRPHDLRRAEAAAEAAGQAFGHFKPIQRTTTVLQAAINKAHQDLTYNRAAVAAAAAAAAALAQQHRIKVVVAAAEVVQSMEAAAARAAVLTVTPAALTAGTAPTGSAGTAVAAAMVPTASAAAPCSTKRTLSCEPPANKRRKLLQYAVACLVKQQQQQQQQQQKHHADAECSDSCQ